MCHTRLAAPAARVAMVVVPEVSQAWVDACLATGLTITVLPNPPPYIVSSPSLPPPALPSPRPSSPPPPLPSTKAGWRTVGEGRRTWRFKVE